MEKKLTFQRLSWLKIASGAIVFVQFKKSLKNIFCSNSILTFLSQNWQHNPWIRIYIGLKFGSGSNLYCTGYSLTIIHYPVPITKEYESVWPPCVIHVPPVCVKIDGRCWRWPPQCAAWWWWLPGMFFLGLRFLRECKRKYNIWDKILQLFLYCNLAKYVPVLAVLRNRSVFDRLRLFLYRFPALAV